MSNANEMGTEVHVITEADRATARRVIRRHVVLGDGATVREYHFAQDVIRLDWSGGSYWHAQFGVALVSVSVLSAAVEAAAAGRAYAAALRSAK